MINKKSIAFIVVVIVIALFTYLALHAPVEKAETIVIHDTEATKVVADLRLPPSLKVHTNSNSNEVKKTEPRNAGKVVETADENFEVFDKIEKEWLTKAQAIVGSDKYQAYLGLREQNDKEKLLAYKEYHDYLRQKYGDKFSYNLSEDQSIREKKINQRYLGELLKLIGPEKFTKYTAEKDQFNEEMRRQKKETIQIEF